MLIVDGMDEDAGAPPGSGLASIASLLPKQPVRLVERLVAAGEFARARALAHVVPDDEGRAEALLLLARSLAAAGQTEDASRTLDDAAAAGKDQIEIFLEVARAQADLEQHARAALVLKYAADAARVMARARRFRPGYTIRLLVELATALDEVTIRPLVSVATAAVHIGQTDMAKDLLEVAVETASQADVSVRAEALTVAARGLIALGERDRALEMIEQAVGHADPSRYRDASALRQATELLFALGERDRARRAFDGSLDAARRDSRAQEMLSSLARDTLELGEAGLALVAVAAMSDASQRRRVISNLAHCCAAGLRDTLIAGALESMSWVDVLPALAEFDVPALVAIADEVMAVNPSGVDGS